MTTIKAMRLADHQQTGGFLTFDDLHLSPPPASVSDQRPF
jgi:hypothetical protein